MRASNVDKNQKEIVTKLRDAGCKVKCLHTAKGGMFDLLVEFNGLAFIVEIKSGAQEKAMKKLNAMQRKFYDDFGDCCNVLVGTSAHWILHLMDGVNEALNLKDAEDVTN